MRRQGRVGYEEAVGSDGTGLELEIMETQEQNDRRGRLSTELDSGSEH
jgi:hypothetical protein